MMGNYIAIERVDQIYHKLFFHLSYKLWSVTPTTGSAVEALHRLEDLEGLDFWSRASDVNRSATVLVPPTQQRMFEILLKGLNIENKLMISNMGE